MVERQSGKVPRQLAEEPALPPALEHIVSWWYDLNASRDSDGMGTPKRIGYAELKAWQEMTGILAEYWEVRLLRSMDTVYLNKVVEQQSKAKS